MTADHEVLKWIAHLDQTRAEVRAALERMEPNDMVELFRECSTGRIGRLDKPDQLLAGMLAAMAIYDLCTERFGNDQIEVDTDQVPPGSECPRCHESHIDRLVWLDGTKVRCDGCGLIYQPQHDQGNAGDSRNP